MSDTCVKRVRRSDGYFRPCGRKALHPVPQTWSKDVDMMCKTHADGEANYILTQINPRLLWAVRQLLVE